MRKLRSIILAAVLGLLCLVMAGAPALAAEEAGGVLSLPVGQIFNVTGTTQSPDGTFTYELTSDDVDAPMPDGSVDGAYTLTLSDTTRGSIEITYPHAGVWQYTLTPTSDKDTQDANYVLDKTAYTIDVYVQNTADGGLLASAIVSYADNGQKTDSIEFVQTYNADLTAMTIGLRDLTIYTGGNEQRQDGDDGYPNPRYVGLPENALWRVNGEDWTPATETPSIFARIAAFFTGETTEDKGASDYPFDVTYTWADELEGSTLDNVLVTDTGRPAEEDTYPGLYVAHITPTTDNAEITCSTDGGQTWRKVNTETAILTVRNVLDRESNDQLGVIVSNSSQNDDMALNDQQLTDLANGLGTVVIPEGATLTVNNDPTLGTATADEVSLLFDELLGPYYDNDTVSRFELLREKSENWMNAQGIDTVNRQYQAKYLDLVEDQDGNLWMASSKPCTIYWPYPEGTDQNTEFELQHFSDLFREYGIKGHDRVVEAIGNSEVTGIAIENTEYGIRFTVATDGYGPFMLSWKDAGTDTPGEPDTPTTPETPSDNGDGGLIHNVATGIQSHMGITLTAIILVAIAIVIAIVWKRRQREDK